MIFTLYIIYIPIYSCVLFSDCCFTNHITISVAYFFAEQPYMSGQVSITIPLESDEAYGFSDFPYLVVTDADAKEDLSIMTKDPCGLNDELVRAERTANLALEIADEEEEKYWEEMCRIGAEWAAEIDREEELRDQQLEALERERDRRLEMEEEEERYWEEMRRIGAEWAAELDREEELREQLEAKAKLEAELDAEFEAVHLKYLAKKQKKEQAAALKKIVV